MRLNSKQIIGLPVETKSKQHLGKIGSFDVDADTGQVQTFHVKTRGLVKGLLDEELLVNWSQVIEMNDERMVVADASVPQGVRALAARPVESASASGPLARSDS
jgi:sporulation protein YlmC with PRC-barrel domain